VHCWKPQRAEKSGVTTLAHFLPSFFFAPVSIDHTAKSHFPIQIVLHRVRKEREGHVRAALLGFWFLCHVRSALCNNNLDLEAGADYYYEIATLKESRFFNYLFSFYINTDF